MYRVRDEETQDTSENDDFQEVSAETGENVPGNIICIFLFHDQTNIITNGIKLQKTSLQLKKKPPQILPFVEPLDV